MPTIITKPEVEIAPDVLKELLEQVQEEGPGGGALRQHCPDDVRSLHSDLAHHPICSITTPITEVS